MAVAAAPYLEPPSAPADDDRFVVLHGVEWKTYCALRELFDGRGVRMTYLKGALEIRASGYAEVPRSGLVPGLDFEMLASFAEQADQHEALKSYRDRLRESSG